MNKAGVEAAIGAFKEAGIDLLITVPEEPTYPLVEAARRDPFFTTVTAVGEGNGIAACGGAALAGRDCVFITGVAGLLVGAWALSQVGTIFEAPFLILAAYRGDFGDRTQVGGSQMLMFKQVAEPLLNALRVQYRVVDRRDALADSIRDAHFLALDYGTPVALLLTGEALW